jgi:long-chain acyl-CoA synthetase
MSAAVRQETEPVAGGVAQTVTALFQQMAHRCGDAPALHFRLGQGWATISWREYLLAVTRIGNAILAEGLEPQERVAIWSNNRPEWQIADLGIVHAGGASVALYQTLPPEQIFYILDHSESRLVVVQERKQLDVIAGMRARLPNLRRVIVIEGDAPELEGWVITWQDALRKGEEFGRTRPGLLSSRWQAVRPDDMASLIYTSGTTGTPKAAIITHRNFTWTIQSALEAQPGSVDDRLYSYLPLAHVLERIVSHMRQLSTGCQVYFCPSVDQVMQLIRDVRPTYFTSVPRIWEKTYAAIRSGMDKTEGFKRVIRDWALKIAALKTEAYEQRRQPSAWLNWQWGMADRLVYHKIRDKIGLDQVKICISGSAPVSADILRFFYGLGIEICEGYGLTETTAPATVNRPGRAKFGTVGQALPGVELRIAADGEILVHGPNVFAGYLKDPKNTAEALTSDGWLRSGDIGALDEEGYLKITDRKKDLCKTSGGKYVAPGPMEVALNRHPGISQSVVLCDARPFVAALFTLNREVPETREGPDSPAVQRLVDEAVAEVNRGLSHPEQIKKWKILDGDFVVGDELTPSLKVKRKRIAEKYATEIAAIYADKTIT